jgi:anti-sigma factor RsiW
MTCFFTRNVLDLYVKGRLAPGQARLVKAHLGSCRKCAAEADVWENMFTGLRSLPARPEPVGLKAALKAAVKASAQAPVHNEEASSAAYAQRVAGVSEYDPAPSLAFAFGFAVLFVSVSSSLGGSGLHGGTGAAAPKTAAVPQLISSTSVSGVK